LEAAEDDAEKESVRSLFFPRSDNLKVSKRNFQTYALAVDPGKTTGLVISLLTAQKLVAHPAHLAVAQGMRKGRVSMHEINGTEREMAELIVDLLYHHKIRTLVMESFQLRQFNKDPNLLSPVRIRARVEALIPSAGWSGSVVFQPPGVKAVITDERLREWGLWVRGMEHARDATRHLVAYYRSKGY
jgi:hypothetical protein